MFVALQNTATGHGGQYRGPTDAVVPGSGGGDIPAPSQPGGSQTPGPASPTVSGPRNATPTGPVNIGTRAGAAQTGRKKKTAGSGGYERWEFWWEVNKESFLDLKNRVGALVSTKGGGGFLSGRGKQVFASTSNRPTPKIINEQILPSLMAALEADNADILDSAVLALGRTIRAKDADRVLDDLLEMVGSEHATARQSATLALGVLGSDKAVPHLYELMIDSKKGRAITDRHEVPVMVRAFAALSLGLINAPGSVEPLMRVITHGRKQDRDLKACAIIALGLMRDNARSEEIVNFLIKLMADKKIDPVVRAGIPTALGKLGDPVALGTVVKAFKNTKQNPLVLMSCAVAMGQLADIGDHQVVDLLKAYIKHGKDPQTRHFAYIALGRIGAQAEDSGKDQETVAEFLLGEVIDPTKKTHLPWAALAAAIQAQKHLRFQSCLIDKLSRAFGENKNPSHRGALAIALGLLGAGKHAELLLEELVDTKDDALQGYLCVALGLMNHQGAMVPIRRIAATEAKSFRLRLQAATALGLMADTEAVEVLIKALKEGQTISVTSSAAKALGLIGDAGAIEPLRGILDSEEANDLARAFAAVALGILGEKTDLPWYNVITENSNYRAKVPATAEVYSIL
jgi:HEAT repeat protein